jgi:hypothetical protein
MANQGGLMSEEKYKIPDKKKLKIIIFWKTNNVIVIIFLVLRRAE